jgi:hypothetical protein
MSDGVDYGALRDTMLVILSGLYGVGFGQLDLCELTA